MDLIYVCILLPIHVTLTQAYLIIFTSIYTNIIHSNHILKPQRFDSLTRQAAANNKEGRCMLLGKPVLLRLL